MDPNKNLPPASAQALFDGLNQASRKFVDDVIGSLSATQRADSAEILQALTASLQADGGPGAEIQQRYYRQHLRSPPRYPCHQSCQQVRYHRYAQA